jgi:lysophospholipase L1-like esterase
MRFVRVVRHALLALALVMIVTATAAAQGRDNDRSRPYLALGDSVAFGDIANSGPAYVNPHNFIGYPEYVGYMLHLETFNAGCPGETTGHFLSSTAVDFGCNDFRFKFHLPLHVAYSSSQLDYATSFLASHPETRLVTIDLGANDAFLLQNTCNNDLTCIQAGLQTLLFSVGSNIQTILSDLRASGYRGVIVIANYYSLDYSDANFTGLTELLNGAITGPAAVYGAVVADVFSAFKAASNPLMPSVGGNTCQAGLLNGLSNTPPACDVHPSQTGHRLIARTIARAYAAALGKEDDR